MPTLPRSTSSASRSRDFASSYKPRGWHTLTPHIVARDTEQLVAFLVKVFGAIGEYKKDCPSEIRIGDSIVMITDVGVRRATAAFLYVYVKDAYATYRRAIKAGARSLEKPTDTPYGDRRCIVQDRWDNTWQIATRERT